MQNVKRPIASDLTDTWDSHPEIHGEVDFLVTANPWQRAMDKIDEYDINIPVFWNPGKEELMEIVSHKANVINKTNAQKFYDNDSAQVALLKAMCPNCRVILVKEGLTAI
jgi:hypothetical protein